MIPPRAIIRSGVHFLSALMSTSAMFVSVPRLTGPRFLRGAIAIIVFLGTFAVLAQRIGEPDRSEGIAIATIRTIVTAESSHVAVYGYYDTPECLAVAPRCARGSALQSGFYHPYLLMTGQTHGYHIEFLAGPKAESAEDRRGSPSAMTQFAIVAVPFISGPRRYRIFCVDDRQTIYVTWEGKPRVDRGRCLDTTQLLQ
jgi:hypothetical protein